jgi:hypothetical protein
MIDDGEGSLQAVDSLAADRYLEQELELLEAFNHRNKNQHRLTAWWRQFDIFRRGVGRLNREIYVAVSLSLGSPTSSNAMTNLARSVKVKAQALWLRDHIFTSSYL